MLDVNKPVAVNKLKCRAVGCPDYAPGVASAPRPYHRFLLCLYCDKAWHPECAQFDGVGFINLCKEAGISNSIHQRTILLYWTCSRCRGKGRQRRVGQLSQEPVVMDLTLSDDDSELPAPGGSSSSTMPSGTTRSSAEQTLRRSSVLPHGMASSTNQTPEKTTPITQPSSLASSSMRQNPSPEPFSLESMAKRDLPSRQVQSPVKGNTMEAPRQSNAYQPLSHDDSMKGKTSPAGEPGVLAAHTPRIEALTGMESDSSKLPSQPQNMPLSRQTPFLNLNEIRINSSSSSKNIMDDFRSRITIPTKPSTLISNATSPFDTPRSEPFVSESKAESGFETSGMDIEISPPATPSVKVVEDAMEVDVDEPPNPSTEELLSTYPDWLINALQRPKRRPVTAEPLYLDSKVGRNFFKPSNEDVKPEPLEPKLGGGRKKCRAVRRRADQTTLTFTVEDRVEQTVG